MPKKTGSFSPTFSTQVPQIGQMWATLNSFRTTQARCTVAPHSHPFVRDLHQSFIARTPSVSRNHFTPPSRPNNTAGAGLHATSSPREDPCQKRRLSTTCLTLKQKRKTMQTTAKPLRPNHRRALLEKLPHLARLSRCIVGNRTTCPSPFHPAVDPATTESQPLQMMYIRILLSASCI